MQESWIDREISGNTGGEQFLKSHTLIKDAEDDIDEEQEQPATVINFGKQLQPVMVEEEEIVAVDDDLDIDRIKKPAMSQTATPRGLAGPQPRRQSEARVEAQSSPPPKPPKPDDPNTAARKKILKLNLIAVVVGALSSAVILFCFVRAYRSFDKQYFPFESIKESWNHEIIWDLAESIALTGKCPTNFTPALNYSWPGTFEGCDCTANVGGFPKNITDLKCSEDMKSKGCIVSPPLPETPLVKWKDTDLLCEQRLKGVSMNSSVLNSDPSNKQCKPGFRLCPPQPLDQASSQHFVSWGVCVSDKYPRCPLTDLRLGKCNLNPDPNCFSSAPEDLIKLNSDNECLWKSFTCGRGPISRIAFGEGGICRLERDYQILETHKEHLLLKKRRTRCTENENEVKVDTVGQDSVLAQSGVAFKSVRGYEASIAGLNFTLFALNYHKWQWSHRLQSDIALVFDNKAQIEKLENYHLKAVMFFIVGIFVFLVVSPALFYFEAIHPDIYRNNRALLCGKYMVIWFYKLAAIPVILLIMKYNADIYRRFKLLAEASFSNSFENQRIHALGHSLERGIYYWDSVAVWTAVATIVVDLVLMFIVCKQEQQKTKVEDLDLNQSLTQGIEMSRK